MKLIIFLIYTRLVYTELHTYITTYTGVKGFKGIPEFFAVSTLDGQQMDYYDSITQKLIPKQKWLEKRASRSEWIKDARKRREAQDTFNNSIYEIMAQFNQSGGNHTYQRMYGCSWESKTKKEHWFDIYGYDGEDFITLDLNQSRYITSIPQAFTTLQKMNKDLQPENLLYDRRKCCLLVEMFLANSSFNKTVLPEVSLLQKKLFGPVVCHATGFYPKNAMITWRKNGEEINSQLVKLGEHLPNEDGTFQINATLNVNPEDWKKDLYICVVEHKSWTKKIQKILNSGAHINIIALILVTVVGVVVFAAVVYFVLARCYFSKQMKTVQENCKRKKKQKTRYAKLQPSPQQKEINLQTDTPHSESQTIR